MLNQIILEGRIVKNERRNTKKGNSYLSLVIAYETLSKENGNWEKKTNFIKGLSWKKISEKVENILKPGFPIILEGSLEQVSFQDGEDKKVYNYINIDKFHLNLKNQKNKKLKF
ncbi:MAG TPA: single-stranded DNA-binding protein [Spirochaetota bacterium]|nr:single-stranded DNA-binding protein [Spirochaetota bacterium]HOM38522.1 single-stranded DNA-binding protein [Spirochaetota bacterium]HPQ49062.1 single-stranded DNA-binding protein [Spirochaetota bacterium]